MRLLADESCDQRIAAGLSALGVADSADSVGRIVGSEISPAVPHWKPMATVGSGVREIRVHANREYRVLYVAKFAEAVYVLHAFTKSTRRTPKHEVELAIQRFGAPVEERKRQWR